MRHEDLTKNHILERWVYANAAARTSASGFVTGDVGKIAYQSDTGQYWRLLTVAPTWAIIDPGGANVQSQPANPTGTTNTSGLMQGLAVAFTPIKSGKMLFIISGDMSNNNATGGAKTQLRYGTGTAPINGAAPTGTAAGAVPQNSLVAAANTKVPFTVQAYVTGLTLGTAYWLDVTLAAIVAGTANLFDLSVTIIEL